jgi:hypothetical protein
MHADQLIHSADCVHFGGAQASPLLSCHRVRRAVAAMGHSFPAQRLRSATALRSAPRIIDRLRQRHAGVGIVTVARGNISDVTGLGWMSRQNSLMIGGSCLCSNS